MRRSFSRPLAVALISSSLAFANAAAQNKEDPGQEFTRGLTAMSRGDLDEAAKRFEAVTKLDPQAYEAHNNLAVIYTEQGKYDAALAELRKVLQLNPDYYRGRKNLAELYTRMAQQAFSQAAAIAPPEEKDKLEAKAHALAAGPATATTSNDSSLETSGSVSPSTAEASKNAAPPASTAPAEVAAVQPAAAAPPAPLPDVSPSQFLALAEGVPGIGLSDSGLRLYRQVGATVQPAERLAVKQVGKLSQSPGFYVAVPADGVLQLVPLERGGRTMTIADSGSRSGDVLVDPQAFAAMEQSVQPYLSPAVVASSFSGADPQAARATRNAVGQAFQSWAKSWQSKDLKGYLASYTADYNPRGGPGAEKWREQRAKVFDRSGDITINLSEPVILETGDALITLTRQEYRSKLQSSTGVKKIVWVSTPQGWKIAAEDMLSEKIQKAGS